MIGSKKYVLSEAAQDYYQVISNLIDGSKYTHLVNPCGEISLHGRGGYCLIGDLVPFFADSLLEVMETARLAARFLVRTNLMDSIYADEVTRTNRIGTSLTGIHEFAWKFFGYGFRDLIDEVKSLDFWQFIGVLRNVVETSADTYSDQLGVNHPHTYTTIKPSGSVSKLFALTEGAHLPAHKYYLRWVMFSTLTGEADKYKEQGYPVVPLVSYPNTVIVGFPTIPLITTLGMGDKLVTASEATPEEQYQWLMLLEKYWLGEGNNQVSYTMKFKQDNVTLDEFRETLLKYQSQIRCCSVMPEKGVDFLRSQYEYLPEEEVSQEEFDSIVNHIKKKMESVISLEELQCSSGLCPLQLK